MTPASVMRPMIGDLRALPDACGEACGHGRGSERLEEIAAALAQGRVQDVRPRRLAQAFVLSRGLMGDGALGRVEAARDAALRCGMSIPPDRG